MVHLPMDVRPFDTTLDEVTSLINLNLVSFFQIDGPNEHSGDCK